MNGSASIGMLGLVAGFALASLLPEALTEVLGFMALTTGLFTALARALADVNAVDESRTRVITAIGFFVGVAASVLAVLLFALLD